MQLITIIYVFVRVNEVEYNLIDLSQLFDEYGLLSHEEYVLLCKNKESGIYEIRISRNTDKMAPNFDKIVGIIQEIQMNCLRTIFINQKTIMVCCVYIDNKLQQNYMNYIFDLENEGVVTQFLQEIKSIQESITQILIKPITFANLKQKYLIRGIPSQGSSINLIDNTILEFFTFDENYVLQPTKYEINTELLRQLMQNMHFIFRLVDFKVIPHGCIYLLDAVYGVIILQLTELGFSLKNYYDLQSIRKYYSMDLYINPGNSNDVQVIVSAQNNQVIYFSADQLSAIWYIQPIHNVSDYQSSIHFSDSQYLIIKNATQIVLYNYQRFSQWLYQMSIPPNSLLSFTNYFPEFLYLDHQKSQKYTLSSGMLILDPHNIPVERTEFLLVATSSTTQCIVKIIFKLFQYLDNSLYSKENVEEQLYSIISYPKLPQASIFKQTGVTGSNINILAKIKNEAEFVDFQIGYYKDLQIQGIDWPNQLGFLTILPLQQTQKVLYLVQDDQKMKAIFYSCQFTYFNSQLNCIRFHEITPNRILDCSSFQWYLVSEYPIMKIVFGYISKFAHTVEVYLYSNQELFNLFRISTSLMDEDSKITALTITRQLVYIIMRAKPKIDVYEYMLDGQIELQYSIDKQILADEGYNGEFDPIRIIQNENTAKLIILNQQSIIIGYQLYKFFLIGYQNYPQSRYLNLAIGKRTFYLMIIYDDKQELIEYDYMTIRQVIFRRKIPLFHYLIQTPIQMASIPNQNLIILRAYTPVLQQTVILVFQADSLTREALTVTIPLGYYTKYSLIIGYGGNDFNAMFFHISAQEGMKNLYVHQEIQAILNPKLEWEDLYIHQSKVFIEYNSIDSPEIIQFTQEVTFLNLQSTISLSASKEYIAVIEDRNMSEFIVIENDWFQGWISSYEINCFQCSELITITQKIDPLYNYEYPTNIISFCKYEKDITILLGIETLYFIDSQQNIVRKQQTFKMDGTYVVSNIYCSSQYRNIFLTGKTETQKPFLQLLRCSEIECKLLGKPFLNYKYAILQLQIIGDNILVLDNHEDFIYQSSQLCSLRVLVNELFVDYIQSGCISSKNVDNNFYSNSFVVSQIKINQVQIYRVILNDGQNGLYWIDYQEDNSEFNFLQAMFNPVQLSLNKLILEKLNIKLDGSPCFYTLTMIQDQIFNLDQGTNSIKLLLLSIDKAQIGLLVTFKGQQFLSIQIEYLLQRYANWEIRKQVSAYKGFVAIAYNKLYNYQDYYICIYRLPIQIDDHLIEHPILTIGCIQSNEGISNYFFYLNSNVEQFLQLLFKQNSNQLVLSKIYNQAVINIIDARKVVEQPISLIATNYLTKSERKIILEKISVNPRQIFEIIVSILGGVLLVLLLIVLWIIIWKKNKSRQQVTVLLNSQINIQD